MYPSGPRPIHVFVATVDGSARLPVLIGVPSQSGLEILREYSWGEIRPGLWPPVCSVANTKFWEVKLPSWWCMAADGRFEGLGVVPGENSHTFPFLLVQGDLRYPAGATRLEDRLALDQPSASFAVIRLKLVLPLCG